jgi:hypothetical protein
MRVAHSLTAGALGLACAGCALSGVQPVIDANGPRPGTAASEAGAAAVFRAAYARSEQNARQAVAAPDPAAALRDGSEAARQMALAGSSLVDLYCADFFASEGRNQQFVLLGRDLIAALGSVATGALALASPGNGTATATLAFATSAAYTGVDVYTKNFLFGSNNIEDVRVLAMNALATHAKAVFPDTDDSIWTFGGALEVIYDHQEICTPANIRSLVLSSIKNSQPQAVLPTGQRVGTTGEGAPPEAARVLAPPGTIPASRHVTVMIPAGR